MAKITKGVLVRTSKKTIILSQVDDHQTLMAKLAKLVGQKITSADEFDSMKALQALALQYAELKSVEMGGKVRAFATEDGLIEFAGDNLPVHRQLRNVYRNGFCMRDSISASRARRYIYNRGCIGQSVAWDPMGA